MLPIIDSLIFDSIPSEETIMKQKVRCAELLCSPLPRLRLPYTSTVTIINKPDSSDSSLTSSKQLFSVSSAAASRCHLRKYYIISKNLLLIEDA
jgi:hypothetical protein